MKRTILGLAVFAIVTQSVAHAVISPGPTAASPESASVTAAGVANRPSGSLSIARQAALSERAVWREFTDKQGPAPVVVWNEETGVPHRALVSPIPMGATATVPQTDVLRLSKAFVDDNSDLIGASAKDLKLLSAQKGNGADGRRWFVTMRQTAGGLPVHGSRVDLRYNAHGDLVMFGADTYPNVVAANDVDIAAEDAAFLVAERILERTETLDAGRRKMTDASLILYPLALGDGAFEYRLCHNLRVFMDRPLGEWVVIVDAENGADYVCYNDYRFSAASGLSTGDTLAMYGTETPAARPLAGQTLHGLADTPAYSWNMNTNPGWTTGSSWQYGTPNGVGSGNPSYGDSAPASGHTGANCLATNLTGPYPSGLEDSYLRTGAINCSGLTGTTLVFWRWLCVEQAIFDRITVEVSNDGSTWTRLWNNPYGSALTASGWAPQIFDISSVADGQSTVYLRWGISSDSSVQLSGLYIDDVAVYGGDSVEVAADGSYSLTAPGGGDVTMAALLRGPMREVMNEDDASAHLMTSVSPGANNINWAPPVLDIHYSWNMDANPGWTTQGQWAYGSPTGAASGYGCDDPSSGHTGPNVYGYNLSGSYPANIATTRYLATDAIDFTGLSDVYLRFWRYLGVEDSSWDHANIQVSVNGSSWSDVWSNGGTVNDCGWTQVTYRLPAIVNDSSTVYIRWGLGPTDSSVQYCGWNIDDVEIGTPSASSLTAFSLLDVDEPNVFHHMAAVHDNLKTIDPAFTGMDWRVGANVRIGDGYANAFWNGESINFGEGDGVYLNNPAKYADVIYHEYTHGVTHQIYPSDMLPYTGESGAIDEALSDFFACHITNEPQLGEGGLIPGEPLMRNLDNTLRVPDDWVGEVHDDGRIIGGAFWDLREAIAPATAAQLIHGARFGLPETFNDFLFEILLLDDDDGDLINGSPNYAAIIAAFTAHGIGIVGTPVVTFEETTSTNHNGRLDAGDMGRLHISMTGFQNTAAPIAATLVSQSPYLIVIDGSSNLGLGYAGRYLTNLADPFVVSVPAAPPDGAIQALLTVPTPAGTFTHVIGPLINSPDELIEDDGVRGIQYSYGIPGGRLATKLTPWAYPATIDSVRIAPGASANPIMLHVWDDDGPGGLPGSELIVPLAVATMSVTWQTVAVSPFIINDGAVYIGWEEGASTYSNYTSQGDPNGVVYYSAPGPPSWEELLGTELLIRAHVSSIASATAEAAYAFTGGDDGWSALDVLGSTACDVTGSGVRVTGSGGVLDFGYWWAPETIAVTPGARYHTSWWVSTDQADPRDTPQLRLRVGTGSQVDTLEVKGAGMYSMTPTPAGRNYEHVFEAARWQTVYPDSPGMLLNFDVINYTGLGAANSAFTLEDVSIERRANSDSVATLLKQYDFVDGTQGWTPFTGPAPGITPAIAGSVPHFLTLNSVNNTDTFGFWQVVAPDIPHQPGDLLRATFTVWANAADPARTHEHRLRFNNVDGEITSMMNIISYEIDANHPFPIAGREYSIYLRVPPEEPVNGELTLAFDLLNILSDNEPAGQSSISGVRVERID